MKLLSVVGARPQFVKIAPVCRALRDSPDSWGSVEHLIVHTGQHYDTMMSDELFRQLEIPDPDVNLGIGSGSHGSQTANMLAGLEATFQELRPDVVVVYGDTNSTLAGSLAATKLQIPTAHVEAGLRSLDRTMPEELNRIVADHVSDQLLAPTATAMKNLAAEGLENRSVLTGDIMFDAVLQAREVADPGRTFERLGVPPGGYGVLTIHRAANTEPSILQELLDGLNQVAERIPLVFPVHPRTRKVIGGDLDGWVPHPALRLMDPVGYVEMIHLVAGARLVLTDSGGLQKEAYFLDSPCVTLRRESEWPETVTAGANVLTGTDRVQIHDAVSDFEHQRAQGPIRFGALAGGHFGDGRAARHILDAVTGLQPSETMLT